MSHPTHTADTPDTWRIGDTVLHSRFLLGTAGYPSPQALHAAIAASGSQVLTLGLKRTLAAGGDNGFIEIIREAMRERGARLLPNTAGCRSAREAIALAHMARELYETTWVKLEVVGDEHTLQPDPFELVAAAEQFGLPIHAIGVGEKLDDLRPFDPDLVASVIAGVA